FLLRLSPAAISTLSLHDALPICGRDQDVPRLEVAVDEQPLVRVVDRGADVAEEREARRDVESVPAAVLQDVDAVDVLHDEVRERSEEHTSELQSRENLVCRLLLE